jgi:3-deoxy-D-manno-octulosonate 8-phosphate phosphatase (KDO 8-P phosphatase)
MDIEKIFRGIGGTFITPPDKISQALLKTRALIFDWDGVFNNGMKSGDSGSAFSEIDSMGINLLRFSFWLKNRTIPHCFIITGMNNQTAIGFAKREHFDGIVMNLKKKKLALDAICRMYKLEPAETAFFFDDVIDLELAKECGLSFYVSRQANPLLNEYVSSNKICDYITSRPGDAHAVREVCELLTGLNGNFTQTTESRLVFSPEYETFLKTREQIVTDTEIKL